MPRDTNLDLSSPWSRPLHDKTSNPIIFLGWRWAIKIVYHVTKVYVLIDFESLISNGIISIKSNVLDKLELAYYK